MDDDLRRTIRAEAEQARAAGRVLEIAPDLALRVLDALEGARLELAQAALYRGTIDSAARLLRARPIKTAFDDDVIRALEHTLAERDAGATVLAEIEAARAVVEVARRVLSGHLDVSALWAVVRDYDAVKVGQEPQQP